MFTDYNADTDSLANDLEDLAAALRARTAGATGIRVVYSTDGAMRPMTKVRVTLDLQYGFIPPRQ